MRLLHGDLRSASDTEMLPAVDVVIDAAAQPSVLAGVDGRTSSRQLVEHNLFGTVNMLEFCRRHSAAFVLLSTSRVYSIAALTQLPLRVATDAFETDPSRAWPAGLGAGGIDETFSTAAPVSLYGATKLASEQLALEYGAAFGFPVWINRCGVLAGAGQFARADQGIFSHRSSSRRSPPSGSCTGPARFRRCWKGGNCSSFRPWACLLRSGRSVGQAGPAQSGGTGLLRQTATVRSVVRANLTAAGRPVRVASSGAVVWTLRVVDTRVFFAFARALAGSLRRNQPNRPASLEEPRINGIGMPRLITAVRSLSPGPSLPSNRAASMPWNLQDLDGD